MKCPFEVFAAGSESFLCFGRLTLNARDVVSIDVTDTKTTIVTRANDDNNSVEWTISEAK